ncbi:MAG: LamG-like jellyroll fold domain-containing protein, partial [Thermoguttaceae bacterium]
PWSNRRETQLVAYWISGIDCMNGTAPWSCQIFAPREHGSGAAPLARLLVDGHSGYLKGLSRAERDLLMAWMDTNGLYHGTWDETNAGCAVKEWKNTQTALVAEMQKTGCLECHGEGGKITFFENDWINLERPEWSRIVRAPLARGGEGLGLATCRDRKVDPRRQRIHLLWKGYAHAVQPPEAFPKSQVLPPDPSGTPVTTFASTGDPGYQKMLSIIRGAREVALADPRVDMPGAEILPGTCRTFLPPPVPALAPRPVARSDRDGVVEVTWQVSAETIGLEAEVHRCSVPNFLPSKETRLARTSLGQFEDSQAPQGEQHYALVLCSPLARSLPSYTKADVSAPLPPGKPAGLSVVSAMGCARLTWNVADAAVSGYHVDRAPAGSEDFERLTATPVRLAGFIDGRAEPDRRYRYVVRAVSRRGLESEASDPVEVTVEPVPGPVLNAPLAESAEASLLDGTGVAGKLEGPAACRDSSLDLRAGGYLTYPNDGRFSLQQPLSVECWVRFEKRTQMPVVVSCGLWNQGGWFLQWLGNGWRWHVGGVDCDGGLPEIGRWLHMAGTFDGTTARLFQDGKLVAEASGTFNTAPWTGLLHVGQYSGGPNPGFQVDGQIRGLKIHYRPLTAQETAPAP